MKSSIAEMFALFFEGKYLLTKLVSLLIKKWYFQYIWKYFSSAGSSVWITGFLQLS